MYFFPALPVSRQTATKYVNIFAILFQWKSVDKSCGGIPQARNDEQLHRQRIFADRLFGNPQVSLTQSACKGLFLNLCLIFRASEAEFLSTYHTIGSDIAGFNAPDWSGQKGCGEPDNNYGPFLKRMDKTGSPVVPGTAT